MWCQPYTEADTSNQTLAVGQKSGQASGICELPELPSMEEGSISLTEDSRRQPAPNLTHPVLLGTYVLKYLYIIQPPRNLESAIII